MYSVCTDINNGTEPTQHKAFTTCSVSLLTTDWSNIEMHLCEERILF